MSCTAEMGMAETNNGFIVVLITGTIAVNIRVVFPVLFVRDGIGIRTKLYHPERDTGPGKSMPHFLGADERIYIAYKFFRLRNRLRKQIAGKHYSGYG